MKLTRGDSLCSIAFSPDGKLLAVGAGGRIFFYDAETGSVQHILRGHGDACVFCCAFSPEGKILATGGGRGDNTIHLWNLPAGELQAVLSGHRDEVLSVEFSSDGKTLVSDGRFWFENAPGRWRIPKFAQPDCPGWSWSPS